MAKNTQTWLPTTFDSYFGVFQMLALRRVCLSYSSVICLYFSFWLTLSCDGFTSLVGWILSPWRDCLRAPSWIITWICVAQTWGKKRFHFVLALAFFRLYVVIASEKRHKMMSRRFKMASPKCRHFPHIFRFLCMATDLIKMNGTKGLDYE